MKGSYIGNISSLPCSFWFSPRPDSTLWRSGKSSVDIHLRRVFCYILTLFSLTKLLSKGYVRMYRIIINIFFLFKIKFSPTSAYKSTKLRVQDQFQDGTQRIILNLLKLLLIYRVPILFAKGTYRYMTQSLTRILS